MINKWPIIKSIFTFTFGAVFVLWLFGIIIQFINSVLNKDYSMFFEYGQIALTVFGFTLIGGIFENKKPTPKIVKQLFDSSLSFLITAISFFFIYSLSSVFTRNIESMEFYQEWMIVGPFVIAFGIGIAGIITGLLELFRLLLNYRISFDKDEIDN